MAEKKKFFKGLAILTGVFALGIILCQQFNWLHLHPFTWWILLYHVVLTLGSFLMVNKGLKGDGFDFYNQFMGNAAIRLLLSAAVIFFYFYKVKIENVGFTITFFIFYFTYTIFEIKYLLANLRQNSESLAKKDEK